MKIEGEELDETIVTLDPYNSDLNLDLSASRYSAQPLTNEGFAFMWAGARATHGVSKGKICYEAKILEYMDVSHLPADEPNPHVVRVGFSVESSTLQLGEDPLSYGYGGTGKISTNCQFKDFGGPFQSGDVILAVLNMDSDQVQLGYAKNGRFLGWAYRINKTELKGQALFPHILTKNTTFEVNFGQKDKPYFPLPDIVKDYTFISCIPVDQRVAGTRAPKRKEDCEMIMMCGIPGAGKSVWAMDYSAKHPKKKYNILGTNNIIDKMKVMGLPRKRNYAGRWDVLIQMATKCLNKMFEIGSKLRRNYILDQTNVYPTAQRRKMKNFRDFKRIAVVVVPSEQEYKRRCDKRDREEGKEVPDSAVNEMKANFKLPEVGDVFDEVIFTELQKEDAEKMVRMYNEDGRAATGPPQKQFRSDSGFGNRGGFNSNQGGSPGRGGYSGRGGYEGNSAGYDNRGRYGDSGPGSFNNRGGRGGFDGARGGYDGGRGGYDGGRGGYDGGRGSYDGGRGGYGGGRGGFEGGRGGYDSRSSFEGGRGGYDSRSSFEGGRGGYDRNRGGSEGGRGGFDGNRGGYDRNRSDYDSGRGGFDDSRSGNGYGNRGGYEGSRGGFDRNRGGYDSSRGGYDSSRGGYDGGQRGYDSSRSSYPDNRGGFDEGRGVKRSADNDRYSSPNLGGSPGGYGGNSQSNFSSYGGGSSNFGNRGGSSRGGRGRGDFAGSRSSTNQSSYSNSPDQYSGGNYNKEGDYDKSSSYSARGQRGFPEQSRGPTRGGASRGGNGNTRGYSRGGYNNTEYGRDTSSNYGGSSGYGDYQSDYGSQSLGSYGTTSDAYSKRDTYGSVPQSSFKKEPGTEGRTYEGGSRLPPGTSRPSGRTSTRWSAEEPQRNTPTQDNAYSKYAAQVKTEPPSNTSGNRYDNYSAQPSSYGSYPQSNQPASSGYGSTQSYGYQNSSAPSQPWSGAQGATAVPPVGQATADQSQWSQYYPQQSQNNQYYNQYYGQSAAGTAPPYGYSN